MKSEERRARRVQEGVGPPGLEPPQTRTVYGRDAFTGAHPAGFTDGGSGPPLYRDGSDASDATLRAAPGLQLPPIPVDLFTRAAAICARRAAVGGATVDELEALIARGAAQAARLLAEVA
ncbi:hypothetical protein ACOQFB_00955 [Anaeromyxobacter sp. Red801]|uniref:hypothetical protein n=1 Tax=Anaeromyxobacter sp. Red801 TaxID=3411632 RepID=UPI003BA20477